MLSDKTLALCMHAEFNAKYRQIKREEELKSWV